MRKILRTLLVVGVFTALSSVNAFAAEWLVDPTGYYGGIYGTDWQAEETKAHMEKWVNERKDAIIALPTQREKVDACIQAVCDFYTYDSRSAGVHPYYAYKTGYGVCKDYARDFNALLDAVGIENQVVFGWLNGVAHAWNYAEVDGVGYYFDLTGVDNTTIPDHYKYQTVMDSQYETGFNESLMSIFTGDVYKEDGGSRENMYAWPEGMVPCISRGGKTVYITKADSDAWDYGLITTEEIFAKYPELAE